MTGNPVNPFLVRQAYDQAAPGFEQKAVLQAEVESRLLQRLDLVLLDSEIHRAPSKQDSGRQATARL